MAQIPTEEESKKLMEESRIQDKLKRRFQQKQGKQFVNNGQGVIPEAVWKNLPGKKVS